MDDEARMIVGIIGMICISIVALTAACITYYDKVPWYAFVLFSAITYPTIPFLVWGDNVTDIIKTVLGFFTRKGKE